MDGLEVFDVMTHADKPYFNQEKDKLTVDTMAKNIQQSVYDASIITDYDDIFNNKKYNTESNNEISDSIKDTEEREINFKSPIDIQSNGILQNALSGLDKSGIVERDNIGNNITQNTNIIKPTQNIKNSSNDNDKIKSILDIINRKINTDTNNNISTSDILNTEFSNDISEYSDEFDN